MRDLSVTTRRMTPDELASFTPPRKRSPRRNMRWRERVRRAHIDATVVGTPSGQATTWRR